MAAIGVSVKNGLWSVYLDRFEWTALKADDVQVQKHNNEWNYSQTSEGFFHFKATAVGTQYINPGQTWVIKCSDTKYYMLTLDYHKTSNGFDITGYGITLESYQGPLASDPVQFNQGKMTGVYSVSC